MKIHSNEQLEDAIAKDYAWRIKELSILLSDVKSARDHRLNTSLRAGIVLLYSHWEGFIKNICEYYLSLVKQKKLNYNNLQINFIALALKSKMIDFTNSNKSTIHTEMVKFILEEGNNSAEIPSQNIIKTGSNLNSTILKEILTTIGIDYSEYELKSNLIDSVLLNNRNMVAHGQYLLFTKVEFELLHQDILQIMMSIRTKIINAAALQEYKRVNIIKTLPIGKKVPIKKKKKK